MAQQASRRWVRRVSGGALTAALLAACGGGELLAILQIVTPLGGAWRLEGTGDVMTFTGAEDDDKYFSSKLPVSVNLANLPAACGTDSTLNGTLDNGRLTLFPTTPASNTACMEGTFTDLRRVEFAVSGLPAKQVYLNDRVAVNLQVGVWGSSSGVPTLKFTPTASVSNGLTASVAGCDVTNSASKVAFTGTLSGFNTTTLANPVIPALVGTAFTQVEFVNGATMKMLNGSGRSVTLTRKPDPAAPASTTC